MIINYFLISRLICQFKFGLVNRGGRNFLGRVCISGRGGGNKRIFKMLDNFRRIGLFGTISRIIYDKNRSAFLALIIYENGLVSLISLVSGIKEGNILFSGVLFTAQKLLSVKQLG